MSDNRGHDYDHVTSFLGDCGCFQKTICVLLSMSAIPVGYMGVDSVFTSHTPEFRCKASGNSTDSSSWGLPDSCSRYKTNATQGPGVSNDTEPCLDGWDFSNDTQIYTIATEWHLVCGDAWKVPFSTSVFFFGVLIGSLICGDLSDRFGRKPVFFFTIALQGITALVQASSVNWLMFCILNCLKGLGQTSSYASALTLGSEMLTRSTRVTFTMLGQTLGFGIGYALLPLFAYFIRGWRMLLVASAIPCFLFIPAWWMIPESPRWLLHHGRVDEAERIIHNAAKRNKVPVPEVIFADGDCLELMQNKVDKKEDKRNYSYMDLLRTTDLRNITIIGIFLWITLSMTYYGLSLSSSNLNGNIYLNCFFSAAIDIMTYVFTWLLVERLPRPTLLFCTMMFSGVILLTLNLIPEENSVILQVLALVGKIGITCGFCSIFIFLSELMPTVVRSKGLGITSSAGRTGAIISPYIIYLGVYSRILPFIIFGVISIMAAVASILLPDTRNKKLTDLISEVKPIRGFGCFRDRVARNPEGQLDTKKT
ncbi:organic cation/carnitine transporter 2-like [Takifugu flavidus]|uniref:organic cation/carnitine transporter 2-like n=1 Tax=Takifugu flavidus TaxID=433684 RepID=UPI002544806D|nr:organic cation/carnitine transporter 2-like [Takifugu flavidus]